MFGSNGKIVTDIVDVGLVAMIGIVKSKTCAGHCVALQTCVEGCVRTTSALGRQTIQYAKMATEFQREGDRVNAIACAIIAAQCLQAYKLLNP